MIESTRGREGWKGSVAPRSIGLAGVDAVARGCLVMPSADEEEVSRRIFEGGIDEAAINVSRLRAGNNRAADGEDFLGPLFAVVAVQDISAPPAHGPVAALSIHQKHMSAADEIGLAG